MEEWRLADGRLLRVGKLSQAEIARQVGVNCARVRDWAKPVAKAGINRLRKRKVKGATAKLTHQPRQGLKPFLDRSALACDLTTDHWTLERVHKLIKLELGVSYPPNYLDRRLPTLGFSLQRPMLHAIVNYTDKNVGFITPSTREST